MYIINKKNLSNYLEYLFFCICFRCCDGDRLLGRLLGDDRTWSGRSRTSSAAQREPAAVGRTRCGCSEVLKLLRIEAENLWRFLLNKIEIEPYLILSGNLFPFWDLECSRDLEFSRDLDSVFNLFYQNSKNQKWIWKRIFTWFGTCILLFDDAEDRTEFDLLAGVDVDLFFSTNFSFEVEVVVSWLSSVEPILISQTWRLLPCRMAAALFGLGSSGASSSAENSVICVSNLTHRSFDLSKIELSTHYSILINIITRNWINT